MKKFAFLGLFFVYQLGWAQTDGILKTIADRYDETIMYFEYTPHSYEDRLQWTANANADLLALQTLDLSIQQTSTWKNLNFFLKAQTTQEIACKSYYWANDNLYYFSGAFAMERWMQGADAPKNIDEFNKVFDEGLVKAREQMASIHEKLLRIQADGVLPPVAALRVYENVLDRPDSDYKSRLGLTRFIEDVLPTLTECSFCKDINGPELIQKYDSAFTAVVADILIELDNVFALAKDDTSLVVPPALRVECYESVLNGIYSELTGTMVLKKGENELLRAEKSMLEILFKLGKPLTPPLSIPAFIEQVYNGMAADPKYHLKSEADYQQIYDALNQRFEAKKNLITSQTKFYPLKYEYELYEWNPKSGGYSFDDEAAEGYFSTVSSLNPGYLSFEIAWLFIHEGLPGHHLEQSIDYDFRKTADNAFDSRKSFSPYIEGWGLYTEELAFELDLYQNLEEQFAFYDALRLRALRMINAYRFYFDGWDETKVVAFTDEHLFGSEDDARMAVSRAKRWNAQGVGYMTGKTILMSMNRSALKILGSGCFSLAEYHDSFLQKGSTHLDTLVWQTAEWIKSNNCYRGELNRDEIEDLLRKDIIDAFDI